jgi:hypothetical protein
MTGPNSGCSAPPAPGQLPVPPPLDLSKELQEDLRQIEAVQDLVVCVVDITTIGTNPGYVEHIPIVIDLLEGNVVAIIPFYECIKLQGEIKPLTEFASEEIAILRMYFEGTYRISVQVVYENKNQFGYLAQSLC